MGLMSKLGIESKGDAEDDGPKSNPNASYPSPTTEVPPAYDLTREQKFKFPETVTIEPVGDSEFVRITIESISCTISFDVRVTGFTSRFGEVNVEYISVGGYSISLYHSIPESDEYFVRDLFYYEDQNGVGGERTSDNRSEPINYSWERSEHLGEIVVVDGSSSGLTVYDWREEMMTHNKPTPTRDGEVVFQYQDSANSGGNRSGSEFILQLKDVRTVMGERLITDFVTVDEGSGELVVYAEETNGRASYTARIPLGSNPPVLSDISWEKRSKSPLPSPSWFDNVVWVRLPEDTWDVKGFERDSCLT